MNPNNKKSGVLGIFCWCVFDWAHSAFPTVIITFIFGTYFVRSVAHSNVEGTALWGWTMGISGIFVALFSPVLGSIADHTGRRKPWLLTFVLLNVLATALLFFTKPETTFITWALVCLIIANSCYEFIQVFYNAMMTSIAPKDKIGRISGWGWALGYFGGLVCLTIALFVFIRGGWLPTVNDVNIRSSALLVALWFLLFSLPLFLFTPDLEKTDVTVFESIKKGVGELLTTTKELKRYKDIFTFLIAHLIYIDGLNTLFVFAGIYAAGSFDMSYLQILIFAMLLNVTAGIGAGIFAWVDDYIGPKFTICLSLIAMIITGSALLLITSTHWFWIISAILGLFVGPTQAASRSYMAHLTPKELTNQMFGIYQFSGRITSFVGPVLVATLTKVYGSQRLGMSVIFILMFIGFLVLLKVPNVKNAELHKS